VQAGRLEDIVSRAAPLECRDDPQQ